MAWQSNRRSSMAAIGERSDAGKKARPRETGVLEVKKEREEEEEEREMSHGDEEGAGALQPPAMAEPHINVRMDLSALHCPACYLPLKPPIFECEAEHIACSRCKGNGVHCPTCKRATIYRRRRNLEAYIGAAKAPCPYAEHGCRSYVAYHEIADHQLACPCAPCSCPEPGCGYVGSPGSLVGHFAGAAHSLPCSRVRYGVQIKLAVPTTRRWHVLVGEEDRCVFLLSLGTLGAATAVSPVCVRANGAAAAPKYAFELCVGVPGTKENLYLQTMVKSSDLSGGFAPAEQEAFLVVPPGFVNRDTGEVIPLTVRIEKLPAAANN